MSAFVYAVVIGAIALSLFMVTKKPDTTTAIIAWIFKWRIRIFLAFWALSIFVALGSGSPLLVVYGGASLTLALAWFFLKGPGEGMI